jgi:hypothetical protein
MALLVVMASGCPEFFLVPAPSMYGWDLAVLRLPAQCLRWVSVKGPHEECGFLLTWGFKPLLMYVGGERGTIVPYGLHTIADTIVPHGCCSG